MRVLLVLLLLGMRWTATDAVCDSTTVVNGRNRCIVKCGFGDRVCECDVGFEECELTLVAAEIKTSTSYQVVGTKPDQVLTETSNVYNLDPMTGEATAISEGTCVDFTDTSTYNCLEPNWVDGKNYKVTLTLNGVIPAPTIIMDQDATMIAHIQNTFFSGATSIHWHGLWQVNTPWMDGVGGVTQCQLQPGTTFTHAFVAPVPGSYWYHSHTGTQRADGLAGSLIVRENNSTLQTARTAFAEFGIGEFKDFPDRHTILLGDWFQRTGDDDIKTLNAGFYPSIPIDDIPSRTDPSYDATFSYDGGEVGPIPYFSSLINGLGREESVPYPASRLSQFTVKQGEVYRFRLIGAVSLYALRFSIDGHNLTTIATDAFFIKPIEEVYSIIVHSGERYDFLLNATAPISNYIMRLQTLEVNSSCVGDAPFTPIDHYTEAILHYETAQWDNGIPSTAYENISLASPRRDCTTGPTCNVVNCPFENFHPSYGMECINVDKFKLLVSEYTLPEATASDNNSLFFFNLNFEGTGSSPSINGRNFVLPPYPPQTNRDLYNTFADICDNSQDCSTHPPDQTNCICTHRIVLEYNKTIQMVVSALGSFLNAHPFHVHGHTFQVLKIGYPTYYERNGYVRQQNLNISCDSPHQLAPNDQCPLLNFTCTNPSWNGPSPPLSISPDTPRKDTVIIPAGGYVVLNFISDNPGVWFAHCHIEPHQVDGMVFFIDEAIDQQNPPFEELVNCQNYIFNSQQFYDKLAFEPSLVGSTPNGGVANGLSGFSFMLSLAALFFFFLF